MTPKAFLEVSGLISICVLIVFLLATIILVWHDHNEITNLRRDVDIVYNKMNEGKIGLFRNQGFQ